MEAHVQTTGLHRVTCGRARPCLVLHGGLGWDHTYGLDLLNHTAELISPAPIDATFANQCRTLLPLYFHREPPAELLARFAAVRCRATAFKHAAVEEWLARLLKCSSGDE